MRLCDLENKNVVIWGVGKEGLAAAGMIRTKLPEQPFVFVDEGAGPDTLTLAQKNYKIIRNPAAIAETLSHADVIIKSPGVSLYHPLLENKTSHVTSLLNLWMAENASAFVIGVTGTKGKSTTATLLHHVLTHLGQKTVILGNIGTLVTACAAQDAAVFVIEVSSYQAANFTGSCAIAVLTSLYPEHFDWHKSLARYYQDKTNLLAHSSIKIVEAQAHATLEENNIPLDAIRPFNLPEAFHVRDNIVLNGSRRIGPLESAYLLRHHNHSNVCAVLTVIEAMGLDPCQALQAMKTYQGLPHRQQELGERGGVLFVDDSISTTPQSAIAAMEAYAKRPVTLIAGGFDRGIDYQPLIDYIDANTINAVICMGDSGHKIFDALKKRGGKNVHLAPSMHEAVALSKNTTPVGGVILLSPAAPSFGLFKDYIDRAACFAKEGGFDGAAQ